MTTRDALEATAARLVAAFAGQGAMIVTAESCTGGMIAAFLTDVPGSSAVLERGFVTYSNDAKSEMIGVPAEMITAQGAVSETVARAMAQGALARSKADVAIAVTGIAGPSGATEGKPVGLVHFALASQSETLHRVRRFGGIGRHAVRLSTVAVAFSMLEDWLAAQASAPAVP